MKDNVKYLMDHIENDTDLQNELLYDTNKYAFWNDSVLPQDFTGNKSILVYQVAPANFTLGYDNIRYSASCRADTYLESRALATLLISKLNRYTVKSEGIKMTLLPTIGPQDSTDNYNTPVEISYITKL